MISSARGRQGMQANSVVHVSPVLQPTLLLGSQSRQRRTPAPISTHCPWTPSVQSAAPAQPVSAAHAPLVPQRGPAASSEPAHSASFTQPRQALASQTGIVGSSVQPPPATVQSTHFFVVVLHLFLMPLQPELSTQSTHAAVAGSHWFEPVQPPPVPAGSHTAHLPLSAPLRAQAGVLLDTAPQRASAVEPTVSQATH
jgi:hypothetical protein